MSWIGELYNDLMPVSLFLFIYIYICVYSKLGSNKISNHQITLLSVVAARHESIGVIFLFLHDKLNT